MTTTTTAAPLDTWEMVVAHRMYRREFRILPAIIAAVADGDRARATVVGDHLATVVLLLHHHHEAEDELLWPLMLRRVTLQAPLVHRMEEQHARLATLLTSIDELNDRWRTGAAGAVRDELAQVLAAASPVLDEHLTDEERELLPLVSRHISGKEWAALNARAQAAIPKGQLRRALVFLGAMLEDATPQEQRRFLAELPPPARLLWRLTGPRTYARARDRVRRG